MKSLSGIWLVAMEGSLGRAAITVTNNVGEKYRRHKTNHSWHQVLVDLSPPTKGRNMNMDVYCLILL